MRPLTTSEIREQCERAIKLADGTRQVPDDPDYWLRMMGVLLDRQEGLRHNIQEYLDGNVVFTQKYLQCPHGLFGYEECGRCTDDYFTEVLNK